jgi:predicted amidohydrolase YtcJ
VFAGGPIQSLTPRGRLSALAIEGDRIVAVDAEAWSLLRRGARKIDLAGRALYPGFIDASSRWYGEFDRAGAANPAWTDVRSEADSVRKAVESGWTTVTEHFAADDRLDGLADLDTAGLLPVHVSAYPPASRRHVDFGPSHLAYAPDSFLSPRVRVAGLSFLADGGGTRDAALLTRRLGEADRAGYQLMVRCPGGGATDVLLDALAALDPDGANSRRHNLTGLSLLREE